MSTKVARENLPTSRGGEMADIPMTVGIPENEIFVWEYAPPDAAKELRVMLAETWLRSRVVTAPAREV
jgi:hypothetical protein